MTCPRERRSRTRGGRRARETRVRARRVARWTRRRADAFSRTRSVARRERRGSPWRWCRGATLCASASRARPLDSIGRSAVSSLSTMPIRSARSSDETRLIGTAVGEDLRLSRNRPAPSRARRKARALPRSSPPPVAPLPRTAAPLPRTAAPLPWSLLSPFSSPFSPVTRRSSRLTWRVVRSPPPPRRAPSTSDPSSPSCSYPTAPRLSVASSPPPSWRDNPLA